DEFEADNLGLENLKKAGYAPIGMITFMKKLQASSRGKSIPKFLSTHPATEDRIVALEKQIDPQSAKVGDGLDSQQYKQQIRPLA
ncbi:MAG: M48 family peptidase, partial [Cyanobacteria bacterium J083]